MARTFKKQNMDQSQTYPDFFKVFLPATSSEKLLIPAAFIACLDKMLPAETILRNRLGSLWRVKVVYTKNDVFFFNGWENFAKDHSLAFGDFLVFRYNGDRIFNFIIYKQCRCEKKDVRASQSIGKGLFKAKEEEEGNEQYCKDDDTRNNNDNGHKEDEEGEEEPKPRANMKMVGGKAKPCGRGRRKKAYDTNNNDNGHKEDEDNEPKPRANMKMVGGKAKPCGRGRGKKGSHFLMLQDEEEQPAHSTDRAISAPRILMPANPSFIAILREFNVVKNYMLVPSDFARICQLQVTKFIKLRVSDGKEWSVRCVCTGGKTRISMGWAAFVSDNHLKVGDICVFNLMQATDDIVLQVAIGYC